MFSSAYDAIQAALAEPPAAPVAAPMNPALVNPFGIDAPSPAPVPPAVPPAEPVSPVVDLTAPPASAAPATEPVPATEAPIEEILAAAAEGDKEPTKAAQAWGAYRTQEILAKPEAEGGLGFIPTAEQVVDYAKTALDHAVMMNDLAEGTVEHFIKHVETNFPSAMEGFKKHFGVVGDETKAEIATSATVAKMQDTWAKVQRLAPEDPNRKYWVDVLNGWHYLMFNSEMPADGPKGAAPKSADPEVERMRAEIAQRDASEMKRLETAMYQEHTGQIRQTLSSMADKALEGLWVTGEGGAKTLRVSQMMYDGVKERLIKQVWEAGFQGFTRESVVSQMNQAKARLKEPEFVRARMADALRTIRTTIEPLMRTKGLESLKGTAVPRVTQVPVPVAAPTGGPSRVVEMPKPSPGMTPREFAEAQIKAAIGS